MGCRQYLILAAGLDSFALRNENTSLSVFEADLPEVLRDKQQRIERAGMVSRAVYVPCDLSKPEWKECLLRSGFGPDQKTFASLLGINTREPQHPMAAPQGVSYLTAVRKQ